jgi:hypothetical protein
MKISAWKRARRASCLYRSKLFNSLKNHGNIIFPFLSMAGKFFKIRKKSTMETFWNKEKKQRKNGKKFHIEDLQD